LGFACINGQTCLADGCLLFAEFSRFLGFILRFEGFQYAKACLPIIHGIFFAPSLLYAKSFLTPSFLQNSLGFRGSKLVFAGRFCKFLLGISFLVNPCGGQTIDSGLKLKDFSFVLW